MKLDIIISLIASVGVVISVIILAMEIRKNTQAVRSNFYDSFANANREFLKQLIENEELAMLYEKGTLSWITLNENEKRTTNKV